MTVKCTASSTTVKERKKKREKESSNVHVMTQKLLPSNGMLIIASGMHLEQSTRTVELLAILFTLIINATALPAFWNFKQTSTSWNKCLKERRDHKLLAINL